MNTMNYDPINYDSMAYNTAERDKKLNKIEEELKNRKNLLVNKFKDIKKSQRENEYLVEVVSEYNIHFEKELKNLETQLKNLDILTKDNDRLAVELSTNNKDDLLKNLKLDQREINNLMTQIKKEIKKIKQSNN
jgi:hypothetical protein